MPPITLDPALVPKPQGVLNVLALADPDTRGADRVLETAKRATPEAEERSLEDGATGLFLDGRLLAVADPGRRFQRSLPRLDVLTPGADLADRALGTGRELLGDPGLVPQDRTSARLLDPQVLHSVRGTRRRVGDTEDQLGFVRVRREIDGVPVVGRGSQATVLVSTDGIEGLHHSWRAAHDLVEEIPPDAVDPREVAERIVASLAPVEGDHDVTVESVELVYHDGDDRVVQPVYRFRARYGGEGSPTGRLLGLVPVVRTFDELPPVVDEPRVRPRTPRQRGGAKPVAVKPTKRPTIGRYVVRKDDAGWVSSANHFLSGLQAGGLLSGLSPVDKQYYWAEPRLFTDQNHDFVDAVHVALTEVHGNWNLFTTLQNNADVVKLGDVPHDGYGGASGLGSLAYWVLHSCEVIPTMVDSSSSYDVWWNIFNGLHAALGYRTEMWINDEISSTFGFLAGLGAPMVSSWLSTVINDDSYTAGDTYFDSNVNMTQPMGRPSAVNVWGHADDSVFDNAPLSRPTVLQQWWFGN